MGILRRADKRGKELPPQLREALEIQAGLRETTDGQWSDAPVAFACNQRDEVRDLHDVSGAVQAQPGMKQQTFVAGVVAKGDGDCFLSPETHATISGGGGQAGQGYPRVVTAGFCAGASPTAGNIGWQEECSPTLKAAESGTNMVPSVLCINDQGGDRMDISRDLIGTLRAQMDGHPPLVMATQQGDKAHAFSAENAGSLRSRCASRAELSSPSCPLQPPAGFGAVESAVVFDHHWPDARVAGPVVAAQTITRQYGAGGNSTALVMEAEKVYCIAGNTIDRQPKNGGNGIGVQENLAYTVTATDRHSVAFSMQRSDEYRENDVSATQSARQYKYATDLICQPEVSGLDCRNLRENGGVCGTLQAKGSGGQSLNTTHPVRVGMAVRRLTPLECERLQGFPDGWTNIPGAFDSARYKSLGNAVAIPCVEFVMRGIAAVLQGG